MVDRWERRIAGAGVLLVVMLCCPPACGFDANRIVLAATGASGQQASDSNSSKAERDRNEDQERLVLQMVRAYLPELKELLGHLREKDPRQYDRAIRNLARSARRLEAARRRGQEALELEVGVVQAQSAVNLLIAKLKVRDSKQDRQALRDAAERLAIAELARSRHELAVMRSRLKRLQKQVDQTAKRIDQRDSELENTIRKNYQSYLKKSGQK